MKKGLNPQDQIKLKQLVKAKMTSADISKALNVDPKVIKKWLRGMAPSDKAEVKTDKK